VPTKFTDVRLARNLDPATPFTQKKEVTVLANGKTLTVPHPVDWTPDRSI